MPPESAAETREWDLHDYLDLALRRKAVIIIVFALTFMATAVYQLTRTPVYGAFSSFIIDQSTSTSGLGSERAMMSYYYYMQQNKPIEYYQAIISSALYQNKVIERVAADSALKDYSAIHPEEIPSTIGRLSLSVDEKSSLMTLYANTYSPLVAYKVAEIATEVFRERNQEIDAESARDVVRFIDKQRQEAQDRLEEAERALQQFTGAGQVLFIGQDGGTMSKLSQVEYLLEQAETERRLAETNLASFDIQLRGVSQQGASLPSVDSVPEVVSLRERLAGLEDQRNALTVAAVPDSQAAAKLDRQIDAAKSELRSAILTYSTESLPSEDRKSEELRSMLTQRVAAEQVNLSSTRNKERFYSELLENYRRQSPERLEKTIEISRLRRTQAVHQNLLNYLVERHEEAKIKAATGSGGIRIVNPASIPQEPLSRNTPRSLMVGLFLGLGLGFGLAFVQEYFDQTIRSKHDLERLTGIQVIGQIPLGIKPNGKDGLTLPQLDKLHSLFRRAANKPKPAAANKPDFYPLLNRFDPHAPFAEGFRGLRTDLQFFSIDKPLKKLLITSSIPGEGKTVVAANLAMAYAELGHKTVILDADIRKPRQGTVFGIDRRPGLTDYFMDLAPYESIVRTLPHRNLTLIPSGTIPPNPTEVLNSQKMADLIERLDREYEYVIVDAPPLLSISDAKALSRLVENILLVFRFANTEKRYVREAVSNLLKIKASIVGFVFNGIDYSGSKGYYRYYYYSEYRELDRSGQPKVDETLVN
jgi:capsular exopolysaccharide synthesis family protein